MKNSSNANALILGLVLAGVAVALLRDPHCKRGCKTFAEHLFAHGIDDLVAGLLA